MQDKRTRSGGPAAGGGFNFQAAVTAIALAYTLNRTPLGWLEGVVSDIPLAVSAETGAGGDDLRLHLCDGSSVEVQVKRALKVGADLWTALEELAGAIAGNRSISAVLAVGPGSSRTIAERLATDITRMGAGEVSGLGPLGDRWRTALQACGLDPVDVCSRLRIVTISALQAEASDVRAAQSQLALICQDAADAMKAWDRLYRDAHLMIEARGTRTLSSAARVLRSHAIPLRADGNGAAPAVLEKLCRWTADTNGTFSILGLSAPLSIDDAWLPLIPRIYGPEESSSLAIAMARYHGAEERPYRRDEAVTSPDGIGRFYRRCVVVAGPGMGKSTLMTRLARRYAGDGFPVLKVSARAAARRMAATGCTFTEAVFALGLAGSEVSAAAAQAAGLRDWVLLLDGLDETASEQTNVVAGLVAFAAGSPESRIVVTTRPIGYRPGGLVSWRHYELVLERDTASNLIPKLLKHIVPEADARREDLAGLVEEALERSEWAASTLASPLMIGLASVLFAHGDEFGKTRLAFFRAIFRLIEDEPPVRAGSRPASQATLRSVLDAIGWSLGEEPLADRETILKRATQLLAPDLGMAPLAAHDLIERCADYWEALGVVERLHHGSQDILAFVHKTFGEFAAGRWIAALAPEDRSTQLAAKTRNPAWREAMIFAAAFGCGEAVLEQLAADGFAGIDGQARIVQALEIFQESDPAITGATAESIYLAAVAQLDGDHRTWALDVGRGLSALGPRLPPAVRAELEMRLAHPQHWTRTSAWCALVSADPGRFSVDELLDAVDDLAVEDDDALGGQLGGHSRAARPILEDLCADVALRILSSRPAAEADALINDRLAPESIRTLGFAMRISRLMTAYGLTYRWRERTNVKLPGFQLPENFSEIERAAIRGMVIGLCAKGAMDETGPVAVTPLFNLAALFELIKFLDSAISDIWPFGNADTAETAAKVWLELARAAGLPLDNLASEAGAFVRRLDQGDKEGLSLIFKLMPRVDLEPPAWSRPPPIVDLDAVILGLRSKSDLVADAAVKLVRSAFDRDGLPALVDSLLADRSGNSIRSGAELALLLERDDALTTLGRHTLDGGTGLYHVYLALDALAKRGGSIEEPVLRVGLMGQDPLVAIEAAKCLLSLGGTQSKGIATSAFQHWLQHEEPYPEQNGAVPPSPRDILLRVMLSGEVSIDEIIGHLTDRRVRRDATSRLIERLKEDAVSRDRFAETHVAANFGADLLRQVLRAVEGWSSTALGHLAAMLQHSDGAMRLAALPLLASEHLADDERSAWLAALRQDVEPDIREAVVAMLPRLRVVKAREQTIGAQ